MIRALLAGLLLAPPVPGPVFTVQDPRIDEDSGMVDLGALTVVTNDSGDAGRVFVIDGDGRTVGTTTYGSAVDAEALAPAGPGSVWVGDTGDNDAERPFVVVRRVPVGRGDRAVSVPSYRLAYPDGAHDAETLLAHPGTGRLYVVTKALTGAVVYVAPSHLRADRTNELRRVGRLPVFATDGSFLADGRHVLVRGYDHAVVASYPSFHPVGDVPLPAEPQGESLSVGPGDRVRVGSEGVGEPVLAVALPAALARAVAPGPAARALLAGAAAGRRAGT